MKLLLDEMISDKVAERLRLGGHDARAISADASLRGAPDAEVFTAAQAQGRAVATYNRDDFVAICQEFAHTGGDHRGLIIIHPTRLPNDQFSRLAAALGDFLSEFTPYPSFVAWL